MSSAAGASSKFLPARIPDLKLWLAGDRSVITKDVSDNVSQWDDITANDKNLVQGTEAEQPLYVEGAVAGKSIIRFDQSSGQHVFNATEDFATDLHTIFIVGKLDVVTAGNDLFGTATPSSFVAGDILLMILNSKIRSHYWDSGSNSNVIDGTTTVSTTAPHTFVQKVDATKIYAYLDGGLENSATIVNSKAGASRRMSVPIRFEGFADPADGDFYEVVVFDKALSDTERAYMDNYAASKWGVTL